MIDSEETFNLKMLQALRDLIDQPTQHYPWIVPSWFIEKMKEFGISTDGFISDSEPI